LEDGGAGEEGEGGGEEEEGGEEGAGEVTVELLSPEP